MKTQKRKQTIISNKVIKVLLLNLLLISLIILAIKSILATILAIILMPIFCDLYLNEKLFVDITLIDYLSTITFTMSFLPGVAIIAIVKFIKFIVNKMK